MKVKETHKVCGVKHHVNKECCWAHDKGQRNSPSSVRDRNSMSHYDTISSPRFQSLPPFSIQARNRIKSKSETVLWVSYNRSLMQYARQQYNPNGPSPTSCPGAIAIWWRCATIVVTNPPLVSVLDHLLWFSLWGECAKPNTRPELEPLLDHASVNIVGLNARICRISGVMITNY